MFGAKELAWSAGREYNNAPRATGTNDDASIDAASFASGQRPRTTARPLQQRRTADLEIDTPTEEIRPHHEADPRPAAWD
jgi:hypothetical protein